jgi:hypothetical protein
MKQEEYRYAIEELDFWRGVEKKEEKNTISLDNVYNSLLYRTMIDGYSLFFDSSGNSLGKVKIWQVMRILNMAKVLYNLISEIIKHFKNDR